ncbi:FKBP-type peptidyl-prolyl cis-trans isomerase [Hyalangium versicolor]|uniref:FKBP-type peptidyl-prolyl cis-trans isomerase n=1 Tax=Hyalangium versicolor TaxID=2861190 RepID=UPI001CCD6BDC|nr:FKBP-type peptidyl-prolyl cis-trans isomerase [Hyalangium versicolor]
MRKTWVLAGALAMAGCNKPADNKPPEGTATSTASAGSGSAANPQSEDQKTLYALGLSIGRSIGGFSLTPDELEYVKAGITAQVKGEKPAVEIEQYGPKISALHTSRQTAKSAGEKEKGKAFLEQAAKEEGAQKTESGLIYKELTAGTGAQPKSSDIVKVNYRGTLTDGKEFDSSYKRNEPATFPLNGVIRCWTEGVQKMKVGGKARLVCPSDLAYGDRGAPPDIPGGATLVFEVELLEVTPGMAPPTSPMPMNTPGTPPPGKSATPPPGQPAKKPEGAPTK